MDPLEPARAPGLLDDTPSRDYAAKLQRFNAFAAAELRQAIAGLRLRPGMRVLDLGCGTGEALEWLAQAVGPRGLVIGADLSSAHVRKARRHGDGVIQADLRRLPLSGRGFDLIWCVNTLHHLPDPVGALRALIPLLRPEGRIALGQSSLLPDMYFAWDARLERLTNEAVRRYYRERYGLSERALTGIRALLGLLRGAGLAQAGVQTVVIERTAPLGKADESYLLETIFRHTWGERLRPYLETEDYAQLARLCDPRDPQFALGRADFHFLQTFTLAVGKATQMPSDS